VLTDFDSTISAQAGDGSNPFETGFEPQAGHALAALQGHGQLVGIISNRAASQITERCRRVGFAHAPFIVGTYGYELLLPTGTPHIDEQFIPHREIITRVLHAARQGLLTRYGLGDKSQLTAETTIQTAHGPVYLEMKGLCSEYPEGLAQEYNFNRVAPVTRAEMVRELEGCVREALASEDDERVRALGSAWGTQRSGDDPTVPGRFSWILKPTLSRAKAYGMVRLLRAIGEVGSMKAPACLVVYAGDNKQQDGQAMWAGKLLERISRRSLHFVGIWADPGWDTPGVSDESDLRVAGVSRVADAFMRLAVAAQSSAQRVRDRGV
jgi:hypothetical protein